MIRKKEEEVLAEKYIKKGKYKEAIKEYRKLLSGGDQDKGLHSRDNLSAARRDDS